MLSSSSRGFQGANPRVTKSPTNVIFLTMAKFITGDLLFRVRYLGECILLRAGAGLTRLTVPSADLPPVHLPEHCLLTGKVIWTSPTLISGSLTWTSSSIRSPMPQLCQYIWSRKQRYLINFNF